MFCEKIFPNFATKFSNLQPLRSNLRSDEVDSLLDGLQVNREYDYFTSEMIFDYSNMLFAEGMRELQKIIPSQDAKQEKNANDDIDEYHPINESELIVRRTTLQPELKIKTS